MLAVLAPPRARGGPVDAACVLPVAARRGLARADRDDRSVPRHHRRPGIRIIVTGNFNKTKVSFRWRRTRCMGPPVYKELYCNFK